MKQGKIYPQADGGTRWIWEFGKRRVYVDEDADGTISGAGSVLGTHATEANIRAARMATQEAIDNETDGHEQPAGGF